MKEPEFIAIVSGLPRSGTSMMMRMLEAGGLEAVCDGIRTADVSNPKGYYELEAVKKLREDSSWVVDCNGKVIKVIYSLLYDLPLDQEYRVLFMNRSVEEVLASQQKMISDLGTNSEDAGLDDETMARFFAAQVDKCQQWLAEQPAFGVFNVDYNQMLVDPASQIIAINALMGGNLDTDAMSAVVDQRLYRNRKTAACSA